MTKSVWVWCQLLGSKSPFPGWELLGRGSTAMKLFFMEDLLVSRYRSFRESLLLHLWISKYLQFSILLPERYIPISSASNWVSLNTAVQASVTPVVRWPQLCWETTGPLSKEHVWFPVLEAPLSDAIQKWQLIHVSVSQRFQRGCLYSWVSGW